MHIAENHKVSKIALRDIATIFTVIKLRYMHLSNFIVPDFD